MQYMHIPTTTPQGYREWKRRKYQENREKELARKKAYRETDIGKAAIKATYESMKAKHPEKMLARSRLKKAVISGKVIRGCCEVCGDIKTDGHHTDYEKPLEVMWLCRKHHLELHRKNE